MTVILLLAACAQPKPASTADGAPADQVASDTPVAKKKHCSDQTGSRLAPCGDGSTGDYVLGGSGETYKEDSMHTAFKRSPN